jgi:Plasmid pRiA4b ORF-3-like protein
MSKNASAPDTIYQLRLQLQEIEPPIWRQVRVRGSLGLDGLHTVIQKVMGWKDYHLHEFTVRGQRYGIPDPEEPDDALQADDTLTLREAAPVEGQTLAYTYDFGDNWEVTIRVERIEATSGAPPRPACLAGARAAPPEDCGGPPGYEELCEILADPRHPEHAECRRWAGCAFDPETFDLATVNRRLQRLK